MRCRASASLAQSGPPPRAVLSPIRSTANPFRRNDHMKRTWRNGRGRLPAIAAMTVAVVGAVTLAEHPALLHAAPLAIDSTISARLPSTGNVAKLEDLSDAFATVAARVKPSVVYITP